VVNFSPNVYHDYRIRVPFGGQWREVFNSDSDRYGGTNVGNYGGGPSGPPHPPPPPPNPPPAGTILSPRNSPPPPPPPTPFPPHRRNLFASRRKLGRARHQFRAVLGQCAQGRAMPVRQSGPPRARTHRAARTQRGRLARLSQRRLAGPALRLSRARSL